MFSKLKKLLKSGLKIPAPAQNSQDSISEDSETKKKSLSPDRHSTLSLPKPLKKVSTPRHNKKGIRVFDKEQDLGLLFCVEDVEFEKKQTHLTHTLLPPKPAKTVKGRVNKHGFPVLDSCSDIASLMMAHRDHDQESGSEIKNSLIIHKCKKKIVRDKHGIPILKVNDSIVPQGMTVEEDMSFKDLLLESLGNKTFDVLLQEKKDDIKKRKKIGLKQRLKAYPLPQSQLDLHGYTALKAQLRTESYLKSAFFGHTHTVIIIVGKGLHSDEGAVLPDVVESRLIHLRKEKMVLDYEWDNKIKSRSGAVTVYLNNLDFK